MSRDRPPAVSVLVTVLDGADLARAAVESMLAQTLGDVEVIVVDDGSTDGTPDVLRELRDRRLRIVAHPEHLGRTRCLNDAVGLARADVVAIMDSDDLSFPHRLERQVRALEIDPRLDLVGSRMLRIDDAGRVLGVGPGPDAVDHEALRAGAWRSIPIPHPTWCGRRRWFERHPYRQWLRCSEDHEVLYRAFPTSRFACLADVLVVKREAELGLPTLLRRRSWCAASGLVADLAAGRWRRAGVLTVRTAGAAARFTLRGGSYDRTWRWSPADGDVVAGYERLRHTFGRDETQGVPRGAGDHFDPGRA
jgi:glycosyltransferase involved in cell wall biosynthesis